MLRLFFDSDMDVTYKEAKEWGAELISMPYIINGETFFPIKDEKPFDYKTFYEMLDGGVLPTTCALSPQDYLEYFEPVFKKGDDILYVHFSTVMSGSFNAMNIALTELKEKYPERKFYEVDTKGITINSYIQARYAAKLYKEGKSAEEIVKIMNEEVDHWATYFYASDLKFFARSGRVSNFKAIMGNIIGLHPILNMSATGMMGSVDKARGRKKTLQRIIDYIKELQLDFKEHDIVVGHANDMEDVNEIIDMMKKEFGDDINPIIVDVNPTAGSHCGPRTMGVAFHAKHR